MKSAEELEIINKDLLKTLKRVEMFIYGQARGKSAFYARGLLKSISEAIVRAENE